MSNKLEIAADKIEIADIVYKYCRAIDRMDRELLESVFPGRALLITESNMAQCEKTPKKCQKCP